MLENPAWYTAYTPYQPEISQGRLEALLNFQTMVTDLTGLDIANASLLDEGTAAAEAMTLCQALGEAKSNAFFVVRGVPSADDRRACARAPSRSASTWSSATTRDARRQSTVFGVLLQYPGADGEVHDYRALRRAVHARGALVAVAADLLALTLLTPPGELGADVVVGNAQRFGVPLGFGGPHAGYMAAQDAYKRAMPGPPRRRLDRRARQAGLSPGAADARAAHPPREGDLQHLHRAGAAGGDGAACTRSTTARKG